MIASNFSYLRPHSLSEALSAYQDATQKNKIAIYYSGGSEIITMLRKNLIKADLLIDLKLVPECNQISLSEETWTIGSCLTLNKIAEHPSFKYPLMTEVIYTIADHTVRNTLTLGGNICGKLPYRESILPLLLVDCKMVVAEIGSTRLKSIPITELFNKRLKLKSGDILVAIKIPTSSLTASYARKRQEKNREWSIDYPLFHLVMTFENEKIKSAYSGVSSFPFTNSSVDEALNNFNNLIEERVDQALQAITTQIISDYLSSSEYRKAMLREAMIECMQALVK